MVVVACWRLAHLLQQVDKIRLYILKPDIECMLVKVYPLIRSVVVCGLLGQIEHNNCLESCLLAL